jgi:two-component system chemotaxis response regulator CheB
MKTKIKVLLVEDSPSAQLLLVHILNSDPELHVLGTASSGAEAIEFLKSTKPDVILMDIHMNGMDGFETTRRIMETKPVPIIVCTASFNPDEVAMNFRAMEAGAVALVGKPVGPGHQDYETMAAKLVETVKLMSEVKVVKRWPRNRAVDSKPVLSLPQEFKTSGSSVKVVGIGASTGGPPVLQSILAGVPRDCPFSILIVQHIAAGFLPGLVEWLCQTSRFPIHIATHGESVVPGRAYLAPDGYHMGLIAGFRIALSKQEPENGVRPSVAHLFRSIAKVCGGSAIAILLTGMGKDGAEELKQLKDLGALTIAQDQETSIVHGMPGAAIQLDAAKYVLSPEKIATILASVAAKGAN